MFLSAVFELKSSDMLEKYRNLRGLSYFADPHLLFIPSIPRTLRSLELRGSAHPRCELLSTLARNNPELEFIRITNYVETMGLGESLDIETLQV